MVVDQTHAVTTPMDEKNFEADNGKVWLVLKDLMLRELICTFISHANMMRNGTSALQTNYDDYAALSQIKAHDLSKIALYSDKMQNWAFENL